KNELFEVPNLTLKKLKYLKVGIKLFRKKVYNKS
ncbi:unnamed protein product, partial [marine sediment metagenome]